MEVITKLYDNHLEQSKEDICKSISKWGCRLSDDQPGNYSEKEPHKYEDRQAVFPSKNHSGSCVLSPNIQKPAYLS